jgi:hypothetical protein
MPKMSEVLRERIAETHTEIAGLEARLQALLAEKRAVLAAPTVDVKTLAKLEAEEQRVPLSIESLKTRCAALTDQIEEALKIEAGERSGEIGKEQTEIASRIIARGEAGRVLLAQFMELAKADYSDRQRRAELQAEAGYLNAAYGAEWPHVPAVNPLSQNDLAKIEAEFKKFAWLRDAGHKWREKTEAIQQRKARDERAALEKQRQHIVTNKPVTISAEA